jgi:DNA modification methylase
MITDERYSMLKDAVEAFGDLGGIVINVRTNHIVGGNKRVKVFLELAAERKIEVMQVEAYDEPTEKGTVAIGHCILADGEKWAMRWVDWSGHWEMAANIAANKHGGEFDLPKLKDILEEIDTGEFDLNLTGFDNIEIEDLVTQFHVPSGGLIDDDEVPEVEEAITKRGDLWLLGKHRVLCGDATIKADVDRLMGDKRADMVFTDPPYGIDYQSRGDTLKGDTLKGDTLKGDTLKEMPVLLDGAFPLLYEYSKTGGVAYVWHTDQKEDVDIIFKNKFIEAGFFLGGKIIWVKNVASMGWNDYRYKYEPCLYGWKGKHKFYGDRTNTNVWEVARDNVNDYKHPTQKPVELGVKAINNSTKNNEIVIDFFLGSGSTLIACEKTNRICYGMEIDEHYCDVIVKRWEEYTGKKAILENATNEN